MNKESALQSSDESLSHPCPRCSGEVQQRFYGPCPDCVDQLRASLIGSGGDVVAPEYVPKMNVTPNAVALKDD